MGRLFRIIKGLYDLLASYLLAWILLLGLLALGFQLVLAALVGAFGFESTESFWLWLDRATPLSSLPLRLVGFGLLHGLAIWLARRRLLRLWLRAEKGADRLLARHRRWSRRHPRGRVAASALFSAVVTLLLVPFVVQPSLVPLSLGGGAWARRAANLVDGAASAALLESVVGLYRRLYARPVVAEGVSEEELVAGGASGRGRLMDRWDPLIWRVVGGDPSGFARLKAVMWVESAGQQYAVSHTGCVGLMQFCARTARSGAFRPVFGVGQVYPCRCEGRCGVSRAARVALESGEAARVEAQQERFPCELTDARFDPEKSLVAGWRFIRELDRELGHHLALTYVGYNSGPQVARRLWGALGRRPDVDLALIGRHLPAALRPHYGASAAARARSLVRVHLPKLLRAHEAYRRQARSQAGVAASSPRGRGYPHAHLLAVAAAPPRRRGAGGGSRPGDLPLRRRSGAARVCQRAGPGAGGAPRAGAAR